MLPSFALERPHTVAAAAALVGEDSVAYCGGTEILLAMRIGLLRPRRLVDLKGVAELSTLRPLEDRIIIGSTVSHEQVSRDPAVREQVPLLAQVESRVGNARVRAQGSIGGNLCFAEPRSDVTTTLIALDAVLTLVSPTRRRQVAIRDFLLGAYSTARDEDEVLAEISLPLPAPVGVYAKFQTAERPVVGVAAVSMAGSTAGRLVVGAVADVPFVLDFDQPSAVDSDSLARGLELVDDLAGSVRYKRHITAVYIRRVLDALTARSNGV